MDLWRRRRDFDVGVAADSLQLPAWVYVRTSSATSPAQRDRVSYGRRRSIRHVMLRRDVRLRRRGHRPGQQRVVRRPHPALQALFHLGQHRHATGITGDVVALLRIEHKVIELLGVNRTLAPAAGEPQLLTRTRIAVGQHRSREVVVALDVLPAVGAHRPLRLVRRVIVHFAEHLVVQPVDLATDKR